MNNVECGSIVIVDDNPDNLQVLSSILQDEGFKVRPALGGEIALRAITACPPDLVLLDIRMPGMDGYETCQRMKADPHTCDIPVIFISALNESEDKLVAFRAGGVDYLSKPFRTEEVLARVRAHLQLHRMQQRLERMVAEISAANAALVTEKEQQKLLIDKLEHAQTQLLQAEKMAAVGQLAAGVAHEINNPIGFVSANLGMLTTYANNLLRMLAAYEADAAQLPQAQRDALAALKTELDIAYLCDDIKPLLEESKEGLQRVRRIVIDLKEFAHIDEAEWQRVDLEQGLESTLKVLWQRTPAQGRCGQGSMVHPPAIECIPSQINQVFMNLLINAAQAIEGHGQITLRTGCGNERVWVEIEDSGKGIAPEILGRIFEPFFTTRQVGQGTGLGLSLSYGIVDKHHGEISVRSELGKGTVFRVSLPEHAGSA